MSFKGFCVYTVERNLSISNIASSSRIKVGKSNRFYIQTNLALTVGTRFVVCMAVTFIHLNWQQTVTGLVRLAIRMLNIK